MCACMHACLCVCVHVCTTDLEKQQDVSSQKIATWKQAELSSVSLPPRFRVGGLALTVGFGVCCIHVRMEGLGCLITSWRAILRSLLYGNSFWHIRAPLMSGCGRSRGTRLLNCDVPLTAQFMLQLAHELTLDSAPNHKFPNLEAGCILFTAVRGSFQQPVLACFSRGLDPRLWKRLL